MNGSGKSIGRTPRPPPMSTCTGAVETPSGDSGRQAVASAATATHATANRARRPRGEWGVRTEGQRQIAAVPEVRGVRPRGDKVPVSSRRPGRGTLTDLSTVAPRSESGDLQVAEGSERPRWQLVVALVLVLLALAPVLVVV